MTSLNHPEIDHIDADNAPCKEGRISSLKSRHAELEEMISGEESRPARDDMRLRELKRERLDVAMELSSYASS